MKKSLLLLLSLTLLGGVVTGCSGGKNEQNTTSTSGVPESDNSTTNTTKEDEATNHEGGIVNTFDITDYGAIGDGVTDCTKAVQAALNDAAKVHGTVIVPPGEYLVGQLKMYPRTRLQGYGSYSFHENGGSIFIMKQSVFAYCMIDITGAFGATISGMCFDGKNIGEDIHGVYLSWPKYNGGEEEDTPTIENCRINNFTGDGIHLKHVWCFTVRHNYLCFNKGAGLYIDGWDGFILDNWFTGNQNCGIRSDPTGAALTITGNRIEWNTVAGIWIPGGDIVTVTGNFFDRSFGPALKLGSDNTTLWGVTVTGNFFRRSGSPDRCTFESEYLNSHIYLRHVEDVTVVGNSFRSGVNDDYSGTLSPNIDIYVGNSNAVVIQSNTMFDGSVQKCIVSTDNTNCVIKDNVTKHEKEVWDK